MNYKCIYTKSRTFCAYLRVGGVAVALAESQVVPKHATKGVQMMAGWVAEKL